jgi:hypothetical protein
VDARSARAGAAGAAETNRQQHHRPQQPANLGANITSGTTAPKTSSRPARGEHVLLGAAAEQEPAADDQQGAGHVHQIRRMPD